MFIFKTFFFQNATYKQGKKENLLRCIFIEIPKVQITLGWKSDFGENKIRKPDSVKFFGIAV